MSRWIKWLLLSCVAMYIGYNRQRVSKLSRTRTNGSLKIESSLTDITDAYQFYNQTKQLQSFYLEFQYIVYRQGLCGDLHVPPMKRSCTPFLHIHPHQTEKFTVLQGTLSYQYGNDTYSCDVHTCPSPIIIPPMTAHTLWMGDNREDLIVTTRVEPIYEDHGFRLESLENIVGVRRDRHMTVWQAFVLIDDIETYPTFLPLYFVSTIISAGSFIGQLLGYQAEYDEYTTRLLSIE